MGYDKLREALKDASLDEHSELLAELVREETRELFKSKKFRQYLNAVLWVEIKRKILDIELMNMLPKEDLHRLCIEAIKTLANTKEAAPVVHVEPVEAVDISDENIKRIRGRLAILRCQKRLSDDALYELDELSGIRLHKMSAEQKTKIIEIYSRSIGRTRKTVGD